MSPTRPARVVARRCIRSARTVPRCWTMCLPSSACRSSAVRATAAGCASRPLCKRCAGAAGRRRHGERSAVDACAGQQICRPPAAVSPGADLHPRGRDPGSFYIMQLGRPCLRWLEPLHALILSTVLSSPKVVADDTTLPVLDPGRGRTKTGRLWCYATDHRPWAGPGHPAAAYVYSEDRKGEHPATHLKGFEGLLQVGWLCRVRPSEGRDQSAAAVGLLLGPCTTEIL